MPEILGHLRLKLNDARESGGFKCKSEQSISTPTGHDDAGV